MANADEGLVQAEAPLRIEVVYSPTAGMADQVSLKLPAGASVMQALQASGLLDRHPTLASMELVLGVWGRKVTADTVLRDRDRVEVYRPLTVDPKEARRLRYRGQARQPKAVIRRRGGT